MILLLIGAILVVLLIFSAFFSSAETALFSLNPIRIHRIRRTRPRAAREIEALLGAPTQLLSSILIGNTLVNMIGAALGYALAESLWPGRGTLISIPCMTILLVIFGEIGPKCLAVRYPEVMASLYRRPLQITIIAVTPARLLIEWITDRLKGHFVPHRPALTGEELLTVVDAVHEAGALNKEEKQMVDGIIRLESIQARDIMTPRVDLIGLDAAHESAEHERIARQSHFRFLPVYQDNLDHIIGFLDVPRFLLDRQHDLKAAMLPHFYVPDTAPLDNLLTTFQQQGRRIAIVIDEYGGTAGMITRGDILDEVVESVENEFGGQRLEIQPWGQGRWLINGNASLEDVNYELDLELEAEGADRLAGWVTAHTEHIPKIGEVVEAQGCCVTVRQMKKHRITMLLLEKPPKPEN